MTLIYLVWDKRIGEVYICSPFALDIYVEHLLYQKERFNGLSRNEVQILSYVIVFMEGQMEI
jgi:hypothetical protein